MGRLSCLLLAGFIGCVVTSHAAEIIVNATGSTHLLTTTQHAAPPSRCSNQHEPPGELHALERRVMMHGASTERPFVKLRISLQLSVPGTGLGKHAVLDRESMSLMLAGRGQASRCNDRLETLAVSPNLL